MTGLPVKNWDDSNISEFNRKIQEYIATSEDLLLYNSDQLNGNSSNHGIQKLLITRIEQFYSKLQKATDNDTAKQLIIEILGDNNGNSKRSLKNGK